jgi:hypothetical protein
MLDFENIFVEGRSKYGKPVYHTWGLKGHSGIKITFYHRNIL